MKVFLKGLLYVPCIGLIAFYLYVIALGFYPQVSEQYRAYYIDYSVSMWQG